MDPPLPGRNLLLAPLLAIGCLACNPPHPGIQAGLAAAIAALPWDHDSTGTGVLCSPEARCDTLLIEPRAVRLPHPAPAFFRPSSRPLLLNLSTPPTLDIQSLGRVVRFVDWGECLAHRHDAAWLRSGRACLTIGLTEDTVATDTVRVAMLVVSPVRGLVWPRVQLVPGPRGWRAEIVSLGGE